MTLFPSRKGSVTSSDVIDMFVEQSAAFLEA
jgi:hypothetical protein